MLRPAADHRVHQDYISDHLELTGERKEEEEEERSGKRPTLEGERGMRERESGGGGGGQIALV